MYVSSSNTTAELDTFQVSSGNFRLVNHLRVSGVLYRTYVYSHIPHYFERYTKFEFRYCQYLRIRFSLVKVVTLSNFE